MPMHEYECKKCKTTTEVLQSIHDEPLEKCEKCGGEMQKTYSKITFHLNGPGFYATDNKRKYLK